MLKLFNKFTNKFMQVKTKNIMQVLEYNFRHLLGNG